MAQTDNSLPLLQYGDQVFAKVTSLLNVSAQLLEAILTL